MDFHLTAEQEQFRDSVRRFAEKQLARGARERAHAADYPWDAAKLMAAQGLLGITLPQAGGGQGGTLMDAVIAIESVAAACPRSADVVQAGNFGPIRVLAEYGTSPQKERYLKRLLAGEAVISVGMTEPDAGSAVTDLATTATPDGAGFRVSGSKVFMTHSAYAAVILAYVRFGPGVGGIGSVLIDAKDENDDLAAVREFDARLARGEEELIPAEYVNRMLDGENKIRVWREYRGLTVKALAEAAGVTPAYLSQIETGAREGTIETLKKLSAALRVTVDDIA